LASILDRTISFDLPLPEKDNYVICLCPELIGSP